MRRLRLPNGAGASTPTRVGAVLGDAGVGHTVRRRLGAMTSPVAIDRTLAITVSERLAAATNAMASAEHLFNQAERRPGGVNYWPVTRTEQLYRSKTMRRVLDVLARPRATDAVHVAKLCAAAVLLSPVRNNRVRLLANAVLSGAGYLIAPRHHYGGDGSDQASFLVQAVSTIARLNPSSPRWQDACQWGMSLQAALSYAVSGWVKLAGTRWVRDEAVIGVMRTRTYGSDPMWRLLKRYPALNRAVGRATLALECAFPIVFAGGGKLTRPVLLSTTGLHLGIAGTMALGRFVPAFLGMYPAVLYTTRPRSSTADQPAGPRDDTLPVIAGLLALACAAAAQVDVARTDRAVRTPRGGSQTVRTAAGSSLSYCVRRHADPMAPVVVFENGLLSMPELWAWTEDAVARVATTVTYDRAGYGASTAPPGAGGFDPLVDDLVDLLSALERGAPTILVGHSLGGYVSYRAAVRRPDLVDAAVLVDPSHPHELTRSLQQRVGSDALIPQLRISAITLALGFGRALEPPGWLSDAKPETRARILAQYRNRRMWAAGLREWVAAVEEFDRVDRLVPIDVPLVVLSAGRSIDNDPEVHVMHKELAALSERGEHHIVDGATHDGILLHRDHAEQVAEYVVRSITPLAREARDG